jgi:hypothetical protein
VPRVWELAIMSKSKRDKHVDRLPVQLSSSLSGYEKESREAGAKLADLRKAKKKKVAKNKT